MRFFVVPMSLSVCLLILVALIVRSKKNLGSFGMSVWSICIPMKLAEAHGNYRNFKAKMHIVRQLYGITLLTPPICLTIVWNLCLCQYEALTLFKRHLVVLWQPSRLSCPSQPSFSGMLISLITQRQCGTFVLITFSCDPSLYAIYHPKPDWQSCQHYPAGNCWNKLSGSLVFGFLIGRCRELLGCRMVPFTTSYAVFVRAAVLPTGNVGISWRWSHQRPCPSLYHEAK